MKRNETEMIENLEKQLMDISIPILDIADFIAMVPMIGMIDSSKSQTLMEEILEHIKDKDVKVMIIDISAIATVDSAVAAHLIKMTKATRLLGCNTIISGISPQIAQIIVNLGIDLAAIDTTSNLKNALLSAYDVVG